MDHVHSVHSGHWDTPIKILTGFWPTSVLALGAFTITRLESFGKFPSKLFFLLLTWVLELSKEWKAKVFVAFLRKSLAR